MGIPGFAVDSHGRIWVQSRGWLRIYDPDFELVDERKISNGFQIFGAAGEIQLYSKEHLDGGGTTDDSEEEEEAEDDEDIDEED